MSSSLKIIKINLFKLKLSGCFQNICKYIYHVCRLTGNAKEMRDSIRTSLGLYFLNNFKTSPKKKQKTRQFTDKKFSMFFTEVIKKNTSFLSFAFSVTTILLAVRLGAQLDFSS